MDRGRIEALLIGVALFSAGVFLWKDPLFVDKVAAKWVFFAAGNLVRDSVRKDRELMLRDPTAWLTKHPGADTWRRIVIALPAIVMGIIIFLLALSLSGKLS
jgi:ABC-type Fe3+-siderophore transport system permease subunit